MRRAERHHAAPRTRAGVTPSKLLALALCLIHAVFLAVLLDATEEAPRETAAISSTARTVAAPSLSQRPQPLGALIAASSAVRIHSALDAWIAPLPSVVRVFSDQRALIRAVRPQTHVPRMSSGDPPRI